MSVDVLTEIEIFRPLEKVAEYSRHPDNAPQWYVNIRSAEWKSPKPLAVGSRIAFIAHFLGRKLAYTYEVKEMSPGKFVMRTAQGPFPMETTYAWERIGETSTRMTLRNRGNPSGFSRWFSPLMSAMMRRANRKDLRRLKSILESVRESPATPG